MEKQNFIIIGSILLLMSIAVFTKNILQKQKPITTETLYASVIQIEGNEVSVQDKNSCIYTFHMRDFKEPLGTNIAIEYTGILEKCKNKQSVTILEYKPVATDMEDEIVDTSWIGDGIFSQYYTMVSKKLESMSLNEKIGQLFLVRFPDTEASIAIEDYKVGGFVFYEKDFLHKTKESVKSWINDLQKTADIPLLTAVDEEGGNVVRVSSNPNLRGEKFLSPRELYIEGGFELIKENTKEKSLLLEELGLNVNLAPVVDVSTDPNDYIYERTIGLDTELTSTFAKTVIETSKSSKVSYVLKHFPGYGNNLDTHLGASIDNRSYDDIKKNDLPPFEFGINALAEAILVSHNTVTSIDSQNPASLSIDIHNLLRNELTFTGVIISDDIGMGATSNIENGAVKAIIAGNDIIISTDYKNDIKSIQNAVNNNTLSEEQINRAALRVLAWKYYKGLTIENQK